MTANDNSIVSSFSNLTHVISLFSLRLKSRHFVAILFLFLILIWKCFQYFVKTEKSGEVFLLNTVCLVRVYLVTY